VSHLSVYFVTCLLEKQIKCGKVSPQAAVDFAKEKKALKTTRTIAMARVFFLPVFVHYLVLPVYLKSSSEQVNVNVNCFVPRWDLGVEPLRYETL